LAFLSAAVAEPPEHEDDKFDDEEVPDDFGAERLRDFFDPTEDSRLADAGITGVVLGSSPLDAESDAESEGSEGEGVPWDAELEGGGSERDFGVNEHFVAIRSLSTHPSLCTVYAYVSHMRTPSYRLAQFVFMFSHIVGVNFKTSE
jgi:hypothetical protein